jgi:hypothetical protein
MRAPWSIALVVFGPTPTTREIVEELLTPEELDDAQKRARDWLDAFENRVSVFRDTPLDVDGQFTRRRDAQAWAEVIRPTLTH